MTHHHDPSALPSASRAIGLKGAGALLVLAIAPALLSACHPQPSTEAGLKAAAHQAVNRKLGRQATFSDEEASVAQRIACGRAMISNATGAAARGQDWVYRNGRLIMDDEPGFDEAALACDAAVMQGSS